MQITLRKSSFTSSGTGSNELIGSLDEEDLANSTFIKFVTLDGSKENKSVKAILRLPSNSFVYAIAKAPLMDDLRKGNIPLNTEWKRERLAYVVSQIVGLDNVPTVVVKEIHGRQTSLMQMIKGSVWKDSGFKYKDISLREWQKLAMLDWLICMTDRHARNWIVNEGQLWAIDNDLSFPMKTSWGIFKGYRSRPHRLLSEHNNLVLLDDLYRLLTSQKKQECLDQLIWFGMGPKTQKIFSQRWDYLVRNKKLPVYTVSEKGFMSPMRGMK